MHCSQSGFVEHLQRGRFCGPFVLVVHRAHCTEQHRPVLAAVPVKVLNRRDTRHYIEQQCQVGFAKKRGPYGGWGWTL